MQLLVSFKCIQTYISFFCISLNITKPLCQNLSRPFRNDPTWSLKRCSENIRNKKENKLTDDYQTSYRPSLVTLLRSRNSSWMVVTSDVLLSGPHLGGWAWPVLKFTSENGTFDGDLKHGKSRFPRSLYKTTLCNNYHKTSAFLRSSGVLYAHSFPCLSRSFCHFYHDHTRFLTYASRELLFNQVKNMIKRFENLLLSL